MLAFAQCCGVCVTGDAMVLGKFLVPGRPTNMGKSRARAMGTGGGCLDIFFLSFISSLWETDRYRLKHCLKGPLSPNQSTDQIHNVLSEHFEEKKGG